jgi:TatD DNase family protein
MFIDSHCHLDFPELAQNLDGVLSAMRDNKVSHGLCICVNLRDFPNVLAIVQAHDNLYATVGIHPDYENEAEPTVEQLAHLASQPKVVGIGETGLDYYRLTGDLEWQRQRFRIHIRAAILANKPLVIHTRAAADDTLNIMKEEGASKAGGVMHCFTESWEIAQRAMELGFYISFSGIVTFKNALDLKELAQKVPLDRMLIETDSPYLAPVPYRGKTNQPAYVKHVAEEIAYLRGISVDEVGEATSKNFFRLFSQAIPCN